MSNASTPAHRWAEIRHVGGFVSFAIVTLTLGAQAGFVKLASAADVGEAGAGSFAKVFLQTAPLTIAVTLISLAFMRRWWRELSSTLFFSAVVLLASLLLGSLLGGLGRLPSIQGNLGHVLVGSVGFYWRHYGARLFLSSLMLGVFLAWVLTKRWPQPTVGTPAS